MRACAEETLKRLADCRSGSVLIPFAAGLVMIMMAGALSIDYGRALSVKSAVQAAADAAVLAGASVRGATATERTTLATNVFQNNVAGTNLSITPTVAMANNFEVVSLTANVSVPTAIAKAVGFGTIDFAIKSQAAMPNFEGEIVMVLDYSSSMTDSAGNGKEKWEAMRDAAKDLIDRLLNGKPNPELRVGLVPFARNVYVSLPGEHVIGGTAGLTWTNCTNDRRHPYVVEDFTPIEGDSNTKWGRTDGDDAIDADEYDDCSNYASRNLEVRPLTNDHDAVKNQLTAMVPHSGTNISAGMSFGWHVISPNEPFTEGAVYGDIGKTIILLSDGEQTVKSFGPGGSYNVNEGELNLVDMCTAIKSKGVRLITVAFGTSIGGATLNRLQNCASTSQFFYNPPDGAALANAFKDIGNRIGGNAMLIK